jgi:Zn-dependent protease
VNLEDFTPQMVALGGIWFLAFLFSTVCHEAAHALAAKLGGDPTAFEGGQASLNPLPHIQREPIGLVVVPLVSYALNGWMMGWASAPYDPNWQRRHPRRAAWMALAGPGANFTLMLLAAAGLRGGIALGYFSVPESCTLTQIVATASPQAHGFLASLLSVFFSLNLLLGTFNLLPVPPLDGSTGIALFLSEKTAVRLFDFLHSAGLGLAGLMVAWLAFSKIFPFLFGFAVDTLFIGL